MSQEFLVFCQGWGAILGLSLPPPFILQQLVLSFWSPDSSKEQMQHGICSSLHSLFSESDIQLDRSVTHELDPKQQYSWWLDGRIPTRQQVDELFANNLRSVSS